LLKLSNSKVKIWLKRINAYKESTSNGPVKTYRKVLYWSVNRMCSTCILNIYRITVRLVTRFYQAVRAWFLWRSLERKGMEKMRDMEIPPSFELDGKRIG